ncbi:MAG: putative RNA uridine N3 methyltransferase [Nitrososphaerales archaeon]
MLLSIAIPDSLFIDESTLRDKTAKIGLLARSASIFGVERIYIYRDSSRNYDRDYETARLILEYAETPQYLRKAVIPKSEDLEFAGVLPPLRTPPHAKGPNLSKDEKRDAVLVTQNGQLLANVGVREFALFEGRGQEGERVTVKIDSLKPLKAVRSDKPVDAYWGYEVRRAPTLARFLRSANFDLVILTSRRGKMLQEKWDETKGRISSAERILVCFGSPDLGVDAMLKQESSKIEDFPKSLFLNTFPFQNVETVRLEEAVLGTLSIINLIQRL